MATTFPMPNPWVDGEGTNAAKLYARVTQAINDAYAQASASAASSSQGLLGEATSSTTTPLAAVSSVYIPAAASVTLTLATQRRVRVSVTCDFQIGSTAARFLLRPGYNAGATPNSTATVIGLAASASCSTAGSGGVNSASTEYTVLLAAGQYTFYAGVFKGSGGSSTDVAASNRVSVYDAGPT